MVEETQLPLGMIRQLVEMFVVLDRSSDRAESHPGFDILHLR